MKTSIIMLCALCWISLRSAAQSSIPNGDFENWTHGTYENPLNYNHSSNSEAFFRYGTPFNCIKSTMAYHGNYAVQLTTETGGAMGYFINVQPSGNPPWHGGFPYGQKPAGIRGFYQSTIPAGDSALILADFSLAGNNIGNYVFKLFGTHSSYTPFSFVFNPPLAEAPDSVVFAVTSSDVFSNVAKTGSMILIDSVSFTGGVSQPALLNGDFEAWKTQTVNKLADWISQSSDTLSVMRTTDKVAGNYAVELRTIAGNNNGHFKAESGGISTGSFDNACQCEKGGNPFANQIDTLTFYYKYIPAGNDTAQMNMNFKKNGLSIWGYGAKLMASASYQYMEIPVNTGQLPDSVIIGFNSSQYNDSLLSNVGSDLKLDEIVFKSEKMIPTGIVGNVKNDHITVFPNPGYGIFMVKSDVKMGSVEVMNMKGEKVYSARIDADKATIDLTKHPEGVYFYRILSDRKIVATGKIVIKYDSN
jgi:hypothetical protein